jgi:hypothetical protein
MSATNSPLDTRSTTAGADAPGPSRGLAIAALALAVGLVILSFADQIWATFGWDQPWSDEHAPAAPWRASNLLMTLTFAALALALRASMPRLTDLGRVARVAGWVLVGSFAVLAAGFGVITITARTGEQLPWLAPSMLAFFVMFLAGIPFGVGLVRRTPERVIGWLYILAIPAILVTAAIGAATGSDFGHPAVGETCIYLGTAALALRSSR